MTIPELMLLHHGPECVIAPTPFLAKVLGVSTEAGILALHLSNGWSTVAGQRRTLPASPIAALASVLWATSVFTHIQL